MYWKLLSCFYWCLVTFGLLWKISYWRKYCCDYFWASFGKNWATFSFNIWSHCNQLIRQCHWFVSPFKLLCTEICNSDWTLQAVWPDKNRQMSIKVAEKWFNKKNIYYQLWSGIFINNFQHFCSFFLKGSARGRRKRPKHFSVQMWASISYHIILM